MPPRVVLTDRPICITGASAGIGRAAARACARSGMPVLVAARRRDRLDEVVAEIAADGGRAAAFEADVTDPHACRDMINACINTYGNCYALFANAGYGLEKPVADTTDDELRAIFETNLWGTMNAVRPALNHMRANGRGHILICSSSIGVLPIPTCGAYCATKAAQHHIGRAMHAELRHEGIFVSTVHPVGTRTEFFDRARERSGDSARIEDRTPSWAMQPPERVARAVVACLRRPRPEVWTSLPTRLAFGAAAAFPGIADRIVTRFIKP